MPTQDNQNSITVEFSGGYFPGAAALAPEGLQGTIRRGNNVWVRPGGKIEVAKGPLEVSSSNVGARLFAADTQRASIDGGLVGSRLPYAGLLRYQNACLLFLSENTSAQVYLNEAAPSGLTTSSTAGRLRVGVPDGVGGYTTFDAGFDKAFFVPGDVSLLSGLGVKNMQGFIGVALSRWRTKTNAWGQPSDVVYNNVTANTNTVLGINLPFTVSGQDGWLLLGTRWGDRSGQLRLVRRVYLTPRGTFTAINGSASLTGLNTFWTQDLGPGDIVEIDGSNYTLVTVPNDESATITPNFAGSGSSGKTMLMKFLRGEWFDGDLEGIVDRNIRRAPRAAGITKFRERLFLWGIPDTNNATSTEVTGNGIAAMLDNNPEHIGTVAVSTASGSDLVSVLAGDSPMYLLTTTSLEIIDGDAGGVQPFIPRVIAEPGFKAATNACLVKDWLYAFNNRPLRTKARENIDMLFAAPVWDDMKDWDAQRVIVAEDPDNMAVLYIYDNGSTTTVRPWLTQQNVWNPPINLSARILDTQIVNGKLYVTYLSGGNIHVNQWEGGSGLSGPYVSGQYYDPQELGSNRVKNLSVAGKIGSLSVFAARPDSAVPDVSDIAQAAVTFSESDIAEMLERKNGTNIEGSAFAFRVDFASSDGTVQKIVARGRAVGEQK